MRSEQQMRNQNPVIFVKTSDEEGKPLFSKGNDTVKIEGKIYHY